jgi:hypothetical protein
MQSEAVTDLCGVTNGRTEFQVALAFSFAVTSCCRNSSTAHLENVLGFKPWRIQKSFCISPLADHWRASACHCSALRCLRFSLMNSITCSLLKIRSNFKAQLAIVIEADFVTLTEIQQLFRMKNKTRSERRQLLAPKFQEMNKLFMEAA